MSKVGTFFRKIGAEITLIFGKFPEHWEPLTEALISDLNKVKECAVNPFVVTAAAMFPNGIGTMTLESVVSLVNDLLPELEIAKGCAEAVAHLTDPVERANAVLAIIVGRINELPAKWQGKHLEDIAVAILKAVLNVSTTEGKALLHVKLGQMNA